MCFCIVESDFDFTNEVNYKMGVSQNILTENSQLEVIYLSSCDQIDEHSVSN